MSRVPSATAGMTLPEVMIALLVVSAMCLSIFAGLQNVSKWALHAAIRSEAHRLLQAESERLLSLPYADFVAAADRAYTSSVATSFRPGFQQRFDYPPGNASARVSFSRHIVQQASTASNRTLQVGIDWTWQGKNFAISVPLFRSQ